MADPVIRVEGVRELRKALNDIDAALAKELTTGLAEIAAVVADKARTRMPFLTGTAAGAVKVRKKSAAAAISIGGQKAPYGAWLDFGGRVGRNKSVSRPVIRGGRYVYPSLAEAGPEVERMLEELFERLRRAGGF